MTTKIHKGRRSYRIDLCAGLAMSALLAGTASAAPTSAIHIAPGPMDTALLALAAQTHEQLVFTPSLVGGLKSAGLNGHFSVEDALSRILANTGIVATHTGPTTYVLRPNGRSSAVVARTEGEVQPARPFDPERGKSVGDPYVPATISDPGPQAPASVSEVRVTGSHIRGAGVGASPLTILDQTDLQRSGQTTLAAALNVLPQNFSGENTEATVTTRASRLSNNLTFSEGINLRGLGPDATLVLLDGRRLGGSGNKGDFVDLSMIPTIAVSRVEILLDGASALYGSDAVGGVVNVRLRKDLDGGEVRVLGGSSTAGGASEAQLGALFGHTWSGGGFMLAYEGDLRGALTAASRPYTRSADLRAFGGSDFRLTSAFPGNVTGLNPSTGLTGPFFGIPAGQTGVGLTPASFRAGALNLQSPQQGTDILPDQKRQSIYGTIHQEVTDWLELSGDAHYSVRDARAHLLASTTTLTVTRADPFFVSPNGAASNTIAYDFIGEAPAPRAADTAKILSATFGGHARLPKDWGLDGYVSYAEERDLSVSTGFLNTAILAEALGNVADNPATSYSAARDGFFNPFTGIKANPASVIGPLTSGFSTTRGKDSVSTANVQADGPIFDLPGGALKVAVGLNVREERFDRSGTNFLSTAAATPQAPVSGRRTVTAVFGEALVPLVGDANALPLVKSLEFSAAVRWEDYSDFGQTTKPKIGLVWAVNDDVRFRSTYGESFRAPGLGDLNSAQIYQAIRFPAAGTTVLSLALTGGNPSLKPETAKSWTFSSDYTPHWAPNLRFSATWFDTDFSGRVDRPVLQNVAGALTDPRFVDFVQRISPSTNPADLAKINALLAQPAAVNVIGLNPAASYAAIVDIRAVNTSELEVEGLDIEASYHLDAFGGQLETALNATHLIKYAQALTPDASAQELAGAATWPAKWRGRGSLNWTRGLISLGGAVNYTGDFHDTLGVRIKEQATLDLQARVTGYGRFKGTGLQLSVRNVFDTAPPFYNNPLGYAFDPANADVIGRFVSLQLTKSW